MIRLLEYHINVQTWKNARHPFSCFAFPDYTFIIFKMKKSNINFIQLYVGIWLIFLTILKSEKGISILVIGTRKTPISRSTNLKPSFNMFISIITIVDTWNYVIFSDFSLCHLHHTYPLIVDWVCAFDLISPLLYH